MDKENYIYGLRAIIEAVEAGKQIDKVFIKKDLQGELASELFEILRRNHILTMRVPIERINRITRKNHQGAIAMLSAIEYNRVGNLVPELYEQGRLPLMVALDGITDVRNFGAIARTAECCGVDSIIIPERGSVSVGADAVKTSAGALLHMPVCRERNLASAIKFLRDNGYQAVAVSEKVDLNYTEADYTIPTVFVMGAEDVGISEEVMRECNTKVSIPMFGQIQSLNVSVAAGVMMYEAVRQRLQSDMSVQKD